MDAPRKKKNRWLRFILFLLFMIWLSIGAYKMIFGRKETIISPIPDTPIVQPTQAPKKFTFFQKKKTPDDLAQKINTVINDEWNDYSIVIEDYGSDFALRQSEAEIFIAASINKLPILAALYYLANKGDIDLDDTITLQAADVQDYGTGSIRYDKPGTVYSIKTLAKLMIKQSDNTAAYILANHTIGFTKLADLATQWGLTQTDMVKNNTSNQDIAKLFRMIHDGKITDNAHTQEMLSFLKDTDHETRLPAKLPDKAITYHKIGTEVGVIHDAGIITDGKITYYIGIFTKGTVENEQTDALMAEVSKTVYEYLSK